MRNKLSFGDFVGLGAVISGVVILLLFVVFSFFEKVPVGYKGLKVYNFATSQKGEIEILGTGRYFIAPFRDLFLFPIFSQNYTWGEKDSLIEFQSKDGLTLSGKLMIRYKFDESKVDKLFSTFRLGADDIRDNLIKNTIRDKINRLSINYNAEEVFSVKKNELLDKSFVDIKKELEPFGIIIESLGFVGQIVLPDNVMEAINSKIEAKQIAEKKKSEIETQKALTEAEVVKQKGLAEAEIAKQQGLAKARMIESESQSRANLLLQNSLTDRVIELERIKVEQEKIKKWDGKLPQVNGNAGVLIDLKSTNEVKESTNE
jgi:regulator of protease activity HflC (stomatin/prohibitin superfamily)